MRTAMELQGWVGRIAQDPYAEPLGTVVGTMQDVETGTPEWLVIALATVERADPPPQRPVGDELVIADYAFEAADPGTMRVGDEVAVVPVAGAEPTGRRVRVASTARVVRAAPPHRFGEPLEMSAKRALCDHYRLTGVRHMRRGDRRAAPASDESRNDAGE